MEILLLRALEVARALGLGRSKAYELMASGELPVVRIGRSVRVPADGLLRWIEEKSENSEAHDRHMTQEAPEKKGAA